MYRKKKKKPIIVSRHAKKRIKQRMGINKKASERVAKRALTEGLTHAETTSMLHRYLDSLYLSHEKGGKMRVYHQKVFVFSNNNVLITVLQLPTGLYNIEKADLDARKRKKEMLA